MAKLDAFQLISKYGPDKIDLWAEAAECEDDLSLFLRRAWPAFDPANYQHNWHVDAIADHLMAVTDGTIKALLINVPPRTLKTSLCSVAWPAWTWAQQRKGPLSGPHVRFMCLSYAASLALEIATTARRLVASEWYQQRWGDRFQITKDQDNKERFDTTKGGSRISLGFGGGTPGRGSSIRIIDDPHKVDEAEGDKTRESVIQTYDEALSTRDNDPGSAAEVIVMQRLHRDDLSGHVLEKFSGHVHLMLPMEYDATRHCHTVLGWDDPRGMDTKTGRKLLGLNIEGKLIPGSALARADGTLLVPKRMPREYVEKLKTKLGPYAAAGQLQQAPTPRGGGIIHEEWWKLYEDDAYPEFARVFVSVDTAQTEKEQNDEAAITAWGQFFHPDTGEVPQILLIDAWEGRLELNRLVQKIASICQARSADVCMIEAKSNGIDVISEIRRLYGRRSWMTIGIDPKGDKVARLLSVQPSFSGEFKMDPATGAGVWHGGVIWAPNKEFAQMVIDRVAAFPKARQKGIVDTVSQAVKWARDGGLILTREEHEEMVEEELAYRKPQRPLYDV